MGHFTVPASSDFLAIQQTMLFRSHNPAGTMAAVTTMGRWCFCLFSILSPLPAGGDTSDGQPLSVKAGFDWKAWEVPDLRTRTFGRDWPDFLGPQRNSKSPETGMEWPEDGPRLVWTARLGSGYGIGSVSRGRYFQFDRVGKHARVRCLHSETGRPLWQFTYVSDYKDYYGYNNGPRCTPVVDRGRVYCLGAEGQLHCLRVSDGAVAWSVNTTQKYGVVQNFFGVGSTPIIEGDQLIVVVGGSPTDSPPIHTGRVRGNGTGVVALDKFTGRERYRVSDELASYASPVVATVADRRWCFCLMRGGLLGFDANRGQQYFHFPWRARILESVNASTPLVIDNQIFISETYGPGSALLSVEGNACNVVWSDADSRRKAFEAHWNTPVHHQGYLYGSSGRHASNAELRCIEWSTGNVMWSEPGLGRCSLLYVDGHLVCLSEDGTLKLIRASAERYDPVRSVVLREGTQPLLNYPAWAAPMLAHGLLYVRGKDRLVCLELIPDKQAQ